MGQAGGDSTTSRHFLAAHHDHNIPASLGPGVSSGVLIGCIITDPPITRRNLASVTVGGEMSEMGDEWPQNVPSSQIITLRTTM